ncbi:fluoride efflux transporter FluC [Sphingomonas baiyangensis]|uniref:Fluoride-specific ion channel FluC n=1 Tax=Sphingomonas baiyangensis TaxID=2572576 RepID=A0A4U1L3L3_9SPHN|nr:CrcB family protein [Sphingomonas baiyangensis]TKD51292.1 fluoride efflux transporter CrcB [Sphingomonas baiyangensis]
MSFLFVMAGGAIGAAARYAVNLAALAWFGAGYPWATLLVNVAGGLAMGVLAGLLACVGAGGETLRLFIGVGVLGGFTTFSAFSLELVTLAERGLWIAAAGYALASVLGAALALAAGLALARSVA